MIPTFVYASGALEQAKAALKSPGVCVVKQFPREKNHDTLKQWAHQMGKPVIEPRNIAGGMVYKVSVDSDSVLPAYANTPYYFDLHTDCSEFTEDVNTVFLLCEQQAKQGGESVICLLEDVLPGLSFEALLQLQKSVYPFKTVLHPILSRNRITGEANVRYQRMMFDLGEQVGLFSLSAEVQTVLEEFETQMSKHTQTYLLQENDCLLINNLRVLHGRQAFEGQRTLKRVRCQ